MHSQFEKLNLKSLAVSKSSLLWQRLTPLLKATAKTTDNNFSSGPTGQIS
jgi:hypothetical protein